jgi:nucleoside phosphorylase
MTKRHRDIRLLTEGYIDKKSVYTTPSVDYNSGKVVFENGIREFQPDPYPIGLNTRLRSVLQKYRSSTHPLFVEVRKRWPGAVPATPNRLHVGPVGAADQVIDDATRIVEIRKNWRKLIGVEMETYGVYRAIYESPEPKPRVVSFKAVCDFAAEKSDSWQEYAAFMAAEFAVEVDESLPAMEHEVVTESRDEANDGLDGISSVARKG